MQQDWPLLEYHTIALGASEHPLSRDKADSRDWSKADPERSGVASAGEMNSRLISDLSASGGHQLCAPYIWSGLSNLKGGTLKNHQNKWSSDSMEHTIQGRKQKWKDFKVARENQN